jgi:hypothetical protein
MTQFEIKDGVAVIPEGTTEIGMFAFSNCTSLKSIVIPQGVTNIDDCAFEGCTSLTTVTLPVGVKTIESTAFLDCTALATIYVPAKQADYYKKLLRRKLHDKIVELAPEK